MDDALRKLGAYLADRLGPALLASQIALGELTIEVDREEIVPALTFLRDDPQCRYGCLIDICGVDYPEHERRFEVIYHLLSPWQNQRIRVRVKTDEATPVPSAVGVFPAANWFEREAYDLYGILFSGHPDLRRLSRLRFRGTPLAQGLPAHRLCRASLRR